MLALTVVTSGFLTVGFRAGVVCPLGGGEAGDDGAVLELEEVLLEDVFGVVVAELPDETVELESDVGNRVDELTGFG